MSNNKSEIAKSFKNLLQKADEMALEEKKDKILRNYESNTANQEHINEKDKIVTNDRLGIKNIKRIPENPFIVTNRKKNNEYIEYRKELAIKLSIILNKHIHYWLQKEMPKFSKIQLKKHIDKLLLNLKK